MKRKLLVVIVVIFFLAAILGPFIINEHYKINSGYVTCWDAGVTLAYYGSVIAALGSCVGVIISVLFSQKNYRIDALNRVLPYFALNLLRQKGRSLRLINTKNNNEENIEDLEYKEYMPDKIYLLIQEDKSFITKYKLTDDETDKLEGLGKIWKDNENGGISLVDNDLISIPINAVNAGNGPAVNFRVGINNIKVAEEDWLFGEARSVVKDEILYVHVLSFAKYSEICGDYVLGFRYENIYGKQYKQDYKISIFPIEDEKRKWQINLECQQELIAKK